MTIYFRPYNYFLKKFLLQGIGLQKHGITRTVVPHHRIAQKEKGKSTVQYSEGLAHAHCIQLRI